MKRQRVSFPQISSRTWEHPADKAALSALRAVPGFDTVLQQVVGITAERSFRMNVLSGSIRVSERQCSRIYALHLEACRILDIQTPPELYLSLDPFFNAYAVGVDKPFIVLNSSLLDTLDDDEVLYIIGHELGHIMSGHSLYTMMMIILTQAAAPVLASLPLGGAAVMAVVAALHEWYRKAELSCDRAGLLVVQNPEVAYKVKMKMAGGRHIEQMDVNEFFAQAYEYQNMSGLVDSVHKMLNTMWRSHPQPVLRLVELKQWVDAGEFARILGGGYMAETTGVRSEHGGYKDRETAAKETVYDHMKEAAKHYKEDMAKSNDPIVKAVHSAAGAVADTVRTIQNTADVAGKAADIAGKAKDVVGSFFKKDEAPKASEQ